MRHPLLLSAAILAMAALAFARPVHAHGPNPVVEYIAVDPGDPDFRIAATNRFGHYFTNDGGERWGWICGELFSRGNINTQSLSGAAIAGSNSRRWLMSGNLGLRASTDSGCNWSVQTGALAGSRTTDLAVDPDDPDVVLVPTASANTTNAVMRSTDAGRTWSATALTGPRQFLGVAIHPDTGRYWALSANEVGAEFQLHTSDDRGASWTTHAPDLPEAAAGLSLRILGLGPASDETLFVRASRPGGAAATGDLLLATFDGGETLKLVIDPDPPGLIFGLHAANGELWTGRGGGGRYVSTDGGRTWATGVTRPTMTSFAAVAEGLWVGANQLTDGRALALSTDGGESFATAFTYGTAQRLNCAPDSTYAKICTRDRWLEMQLEYDEWGVDEGAVADRSGPGGGCRAMPAGPHTPRQSSPWGLLLLVVGLALGYRGRRPRRTAAPHPPRSARCKASARCIDPFPNRATAPNHREVPNHGRTSGQRDRRPPDLRLQGQHGQAQRRHRQRQEAVDDQRLRPLQHHPRPDRGKG